MKMIVRYLSYILVIFGILINSQGYQKPFYEKSDFLAGICPARNETDKWVDLGLNYVRRDIPMPFDSLKTIDVLSESFITYRNEAIASKAKGIKTMVITPYPYTFLHYGIDPRTGEGRELVKKAISKIAEELKGIVEIYQITNEMGQPSFTAPLTLSEAATFIKDGFDGIKAGDPDALIGYNMADINYDLIDFLGDYNSKMDYAGLDLYIGSFGTGTIDMYIWQCRKLAFEMKKPVILAEFGFMGSGVSKSKTEKAKFLKENYGYDSEAAAIARQPESNPNQPVAPENLAYIIYTSGSTGKPKGVAIEHRGPTALLQWAHTVWTVDELRCVLSGTSICFDLSV
ncbi:MAG: AMP-binding protein, partial [Eubacteriales bacterium]